MAKLPSAFDATVVEPITDFDPLPIGKYIAEVTASDMRTNCKETGKYLWLEFTVLDGPYAKRKVWAQLNLVNPSQQAVEIAQRELSALCRAVGKLRVQDSIELHGIPLEINVKVKKDLEYGNSNVTRGYKEIGGGQPSPDPEATPQWKQPATKNNQSAADVPFTPADPPTWKPPTDDAPQDIAVPAEAPPVVNSPIPPWKKR